jgi:predicted enzyme related to lactoylglutathione lyase
MMVVMSDDPNTQHALNTGRTFVWHELYVKDPAGAIKFYSECLGFGHQEMDMGEMGSYPMLTMNGHGVAGIMDTTKLENSEHIPPHWAVYLAVDDVDARVARCIGQGASVVVPAMDVPGVGRMCLIADPFGAHIWLYTPAM